MYTHIGFKLEMREARTASIWNSEIEIVRSQCKVCHRTVAPENPIELFENYILTRMHIGAYQFTQTTYKINYLIL